MSDDVHVVEADGRQYILVGTAHVSQESAHLVREVIEREQPDVVCVELDEQRYKALTEKSRWENLDIKQVIKQKQLPTLIVNLMLSSYQKRLGGKLGVLPGTELLEATKVAKEQDIPFELCDRNVRTTMLRAWNSMSFWKKNNLLAAVVASMLSKDELSEEELRQLRQQDVLSEMMNELATAMPNLKRVLIDERDVYLAEKIRRVKGEKIVAVVGAGHVEGMKKMLLEGGDPVDLATIEEIPKKFPLAKVVGWAVPVIIVGALGWIGYTKGSEAMGENALFWVAVNGVPAAIGALVALAHPLTILIALLAAPITSLTPVIGAGYVTAFVQAWFSPPKVRDFQTVADEMGKTSNWWKNRLLKVFLAFILPTLGSMLGTYVGLAKILGAAAGGSSGS